MYTLEGTVAFFHDRKKYGFIESDDVEDDVFFHLDDIDGDSIAEGDQVSFEAEEAERGPRATNVEIL